MTTGFGYAWVTLRSGQVVRIDPIQLRPLGPPIKIGARPNAIVAGNGFVWALNKGSSTMTRIEPNA